MKYGLDDGKSKTTRCVIVVCLCIYIARPLTHTNTYLFLFQNTAPSPLTNTREIAEYAHVTIEYVRRTQTKALQRLRSADTYRILEAFVHGQACVFAASQMALYELT
jgi:hypothetical protein